jgi:polyribonucleotide nucleotidyltransferase
MAEPPLETNVYDSVDKVDAEDAGNDPFTQAEQMQTMVQAQDEHVLKQAEAEAKVMLAQHRVAKAAAEVSQMQDNHDQTQRHAEATHVEKIRKLRKPAPKAGNQ